MCALIGAPCGRAGNPDPVRHVCARPRPADRHLVPARLRRPDGSRTKTRPVREPLGVPLPSLCGRDSDRSGAVVSGGTRTRFSYLSAAVCLFLYLVRCTLHSLHRKAARPVYPVPSRAGHQD